MRVQVHVQRRRDHSVMLVLDVGELVGQRPRVVVVDQDEHPGRLPRFLLPLLLEEVNQHQGEGKAEPYPSRGFDGDHGTDLALFVDGIHF